MSNVILATIVGLLIGSTIATVIMRTKVSNVKKQMEAEFQASMDEKERQQQILSDAKENAHSLVVDEMNSKMTMMKETYEKRITEQKEDYSKALNEQRDAFNKSLADQEVRNRTQNEEIKKSLAESVIATTEKVIDQRRDQLENKNKESMSQLLNPLKEEMERMQKAFNDNKEKNTANNNQFMGVLQEMMKRTETIGASADNLAIAMTSKGKVQGNWGEQVLADILRDSGLRQGEEFTEQECFKGGKGDNNLFTDVLVKLPNGAKIIIDSKVSLTAYSDYVSAPTKEEQDDAAKKNYISVKSHIDELAGKEYPKYVDNSIDKVLMFIPNEGSFVLALNYDNGLIRYAYDKGIILVNPTNLMMTLNLVYLSWLNTRQEDNCKTIIDTACKAYDKLIGVINTFDNVGTLIGKVQKEYNEGMGQLCTGSGNLKKRFEDLKEMGVTTKKIAKPKVTTNTIEQ